MKLPKLIALDLDGTLLPSSKRLSERSKSVLQEIAGLGTTVTLATGKFHHLTVGYAQELEMAAPLISLDGAHIGGNGHGDHKSCIPLTTALNLLERYQDASHHVFADSGNDEMLLRSDRDGFAHAIRFWASRVRSVEDLRPYVEAPPAIISFYGTEEPMQELADHCEDEFPELRVSRYWSENLSCRRISLQPHGVDKGTGLLTVAEPLGATASECMVFGDWLNDLPMFRVGAVGVAMANAVDDVRDAADYETEHDCDHDGVARFLERHFLG